MLDYKDVPDSREPRGRRRWAGPLMVLLALVVLVGGLAYLAIDTIQVRSELNEQKEPSPPENTAPVIAAEPPKPVVVEPVEVVDKKASDKKQPETKKPEKKAPEAKSEPKPVAAKVEAQQATKKEQDKKASVKKAVPEEPQYDFYTLLPQYEVEIPEEELKPPPPPKPEPLKPVKVEAGYAYLLQVGSFRTEAQAEDSRGRLALLGFEASIHETTADNGRRWYRVRLGPYAVQAELNDVRNLLQAEGFSALALKVRLKN